MAALIAPRGLIVDLITPLKNDGSVDDSGLKRLLDRTTPHSQALFLGSPHTGEGEKLTSDQRVELLEKALVVIRGRLPLLIWVTQDTEEKTTGTILALRKAIEDRKYAGQVFFVDTPLYYHSNRGLPPHYQIMCSMVHVPFILQNDPELIKDLDRPLKRKNIRTAILKELSSLEDIAGIIFSGSLDRSHNYQKACRRRTHFRIYDGDEARFLDYPSMSGTVSMGANLAPEAWQKITQSSLQLLADQDEYPDHLKQIWELGHYLHNLKDIYKKAPVIIIKEILSDIGVIETPAVTLPAQDVEESKREIKELMARYGDWPEVK